MIDNFAILEKQTNKENKTTSTTATKKAATSFEADFYLNITFKIFFISPKKILIYFQLNKNILNE